MTEAHKDGSGPVSDLGRAKATFRDASELASPVYQAIIAPKMTDWAKKEGRWVTVGFCACTVIVLGNITYDLLTTGSYAPPGSKLRLYAQISVLLLIATFFVTSRRRSPIKETAVASRRDETLHLSVAAAARFMSYWPFLWAIWFLLYASLTIALEMRMDTPYAVVLFDFLNNCTALIFFSMHQELHKDTKEGSQQLWVPLLASLVAISAVEIVATASVSNQPDLLLLVQYLFQVLSGIIVGIATGLFASRLTSKVIDVPIGILAILVFYSVIQPIFPLITPSHGVSAGTVTVVQEGIALLLVKLALYCKVFLLGLVHWLNDTGRLVYYMSKVRHLDERSRSDMERFMETYIIRPSGRGHIHAGSETRKDGSVAEAGADQHTH